MHIFEYPVVRPRKSGAYRVRFHLLAMRKFVLLAIVALFFGAFTTQKASAQTRVLSVCPVCHQNVYAHYRPINYGGVVRYSWVPAYHTRCASRAVRVNPTRYVTKYHRGVPYRYAVPSRSRTHFQSPRHSGFVRPGFSITIRR